MSLPITFIEKFIRLPNAVTLHYVEQGAADGTPVILVHGYPDSWFSYAGVMAYLPEQLRVIAPSLRGYGESDRSYGNYHPRDLAADLNEFMIKLGVASAHIVGHSMGSYVAEYLALDHPERVRSLTLIGTFRNLVGRADLAELLAALDEMGDEVDAALVREFQESTLAQPVPAEFLDAIIAESRKVPGHVWHGALQELTRIDHFDELRRITAPTTIFWGDRDGLSTLRDQHAIAAATGGELRLYAGAGHSLQWEEPKRFAQDLAKVIDQVETQGKVRRTISQHRR
ncbi:MAG TPA: alpha/beta hydrolase [Dongiaceae bacterium]|nr:alpha/beta hydrolase [Dongiaceae bacterium]